MYIELVGNEKAFDEVIIMIPWWITFERGIPEYLFQGKIVTQAILFVFHWNLSCNKRFKNFLVSYQRDKESNSAEEYRI